MQTQKIYPMPLILFGSEFRSGLLDWNKSTVIEYETISEEDLDYIKVTDDPQEVLDIMLEHRQWKHEQRQLGLKIMILLFRNGQACRSTTQ